MKNYFRLTLIALVGVPVSWLAWHSMGVGAPPNQNNYQWDETREVALFQGGREGPPPRRDDDRRGPPRDDGFGRPGEGPPQGPPPFGGPGGPGGERPPGPPPPPPPRPGEGRPGEGHPGGGRPPHPLGPGGGQEMQHLRQIDPEMAELVESDQELERKTYQLAEAFRYASEEKRAEIRESLGKAVLEHFEIRQDRRQLELKRLEAELTRLRGSIEARTKAREEIVNRRVNELLGDDKLKF